MKKTQRLLCLLTTLILLLAQLPALADGYVPLTQQEIAQARQLIAMEGDIQGWEKGMTPSASMNALQIQQYLEWLLSDEVGGLLVRIRDKAELLGNQSLEGVEDLLRQFRDQLDHYRDRLETGRLTVFNSLHQLEADAELTQREKCRLTDKVREYVAEMQTIIGTVVRYYQQYEEAVDSHELNFLNVLQAADTPDGAITQQAEEKLLAEAEALTNEEQAHIDARNSVDFSVVTLSTKQFGFIIRDHEGKLLKDARSPYRRRLSPFPEDRHHRGKRTGLLPGGGFRPHVEPAGHAGRGRHPQPAQHPGNAPSHSAGRAGGDRPTGKIHRRSLPAHGLL